MKVPLIGVTMGDPAGVGPEIVLKSYLDPLVRQQELVVIGDFRMLERMRQSLGIIDFQLKAITHMEAFQANSDKLQVFDLNNADPKEIMLGKIQAKAGKAAFEAVKKAAELAIDGQIQAIATAPLHKEAMHLAGHLYPGHTEILGELTGTKEFAMLLYDEQLKVIHISTHISLLKAVQTLDKNRILSVIEIGHRMLTQLGFCDPRIAVAGLNPHAGENGLFGDEEIKHIQPAIALAREKGIKVFGPEPPDTVFLKAKEGTYDLVVAMYHDQGHIPLKLLGFHSGVNVTAGLPVIRTSVDHGTAMDIAGKKIASEHSMKAAVLLAVRLAKASVAQRTNS